MSNEATIMADGGELLLVDCCSADLFQSATAVAQGTDLMDRIRAYATARVTTIYRCLIADYGPQQRVEVDFEESAIGVGPADVKK
jgi:hypothetical protein